jgi:aminopeptidase N
VKCESRPTQVILDCCDLKILSVTNMDDGTTPPPPPMLSRINYFPHWFITGSNLDFSVDIWKINISIPQDGPFPTRINIEYETTPRPGSLLWWDSAEYGAVAFTNGSPISNRSLLPCQDAPKCMSSYPLIQCQYSAIHNT